MDGIVTTGHWEGILRLTGKVFIPVTRYQGLLVTKRDNPYRGHPWMALVEQHGARRRA
jgi:hypothetical protein